MVTPSSFNRRSGPTRAERAWPPIRPPTYPRRAVALRCSEPDPWRHLPIRRGRVSMRHAHPHPPPISRMARLLAHLLRRCSGRDDCKASATPSTPTMGMELRILSRQSHPSNARTALPRPSTRPAPTSSAHGGCFCQIARKRICRPRRRGRLHHQTFKARSAPIDLVEIKTAAGILACGLPGSISLEQNAAAPPPRFSKLEPS